MYTSASVPLSQKLNELVIEKAMPVNAKDTEVAENTSPKVYSKMDLHLKNEPHDQLLRFSQYDQDNQETPVDDVTDSELKTGSLQHTENTSQGRNSFS